MLMLTIIFTHTHAAIGDTTVINFERDSYEVVEDIGLKGFALQVCITVADLTSERTVTITTVPGTAQGIICCYVSKARCFYYKAVRTLYSC